jgi:uncharacterized membrane protein
MKKLIAVLFLVVALILLFNGLLHSNARRMVTEQLVTVSEPEIAKTYYGQLKGVQDTFLIDSANPFELYVNVAVPDGAQAKKNIWAEIYTLEETPQADGKIFQKKTSVALLDPNKVDWTTSYDSIIGESYLKGAELKDDQSGGNVKGVVEQPGKYYIKVFDINDEDEESNGNFILTIGAKEKISTDEAINTIRILPNIQSSLWGKTQYMAYVNLVGLMLVIPIILFIAIIVFIARKISKKVKKKNTENKDKSDKLENNPQVQAVEKENEEDKSDKV